MRSRYSVSWRISGSTWRRAQRQLRVAFQIAAHEVVFAGAGFQRGGAGSSVDATPYFLARTSTPRMRRTATSPMLAMHGLAQRADVRSGFSARRSSCCVPSGVRRGTIFVLDAMAAALLAQVLAQQLAGEGIEQAHVRGIPLHLERGGRSSPAARYSRRLRLRRSHPDARCARRIGNSGRARRGSGSSAGFSSANMAATCRLVVP